MRNMNSLEALEVYVSAVEAGSFSAAARKLGLQQSTISRTVGALEEGFGAVLIRRTTRKMTLTEAGNLFLVECRRILADVRDLEARMRRVRDEPEGVLRISLPTAFGKMIVVPALAEFVQRFPAIALEIHHADEFVDIVSGGYDVVVRVGASDDSAITRRKIAVIRRGLFCGKALLKRLGRIEAPADLARFPILAFDDRLPESTQWKLRRGGQRKTVAAPSAMAVDQLDSVGILLKEGLGVAYAPLFFAEAPAIAPHVERVLPDWEVEHRLEPASNVYALFPGGPKTSAKVRVFVDFLVERLAGTDS